MKTTLLVSYQVASPEHDAYIRRAIESLLTGPVAFAAEPPVEIEDADRWRLMAARTEGAK